MNAEKIINWPRQTSSGTFNATVRGGSAEGYVIQGPSGLVAASAAFSCMVRPMPGDRVMCNRDDDGKHYILFILERPTGPDAVLSFPGDVILESATGHVTMAAGAGIDLATAKTVNLLAGEMNLSAASAQINVVEMQATGESFTGTVSRMRMVSESIDVVAQRVTERLKTCFRWVEDIEQVTAGQVIKNIRNLFSVRARQSAITATDDVKIDGERVHIG